MSEAPVHGSAVRLGPTGVLVRGPSGSGKSSLALALIDGGAELVADDRVILRRIADSLQVEAVPSIAGLIEVRGQGIFRIAFRSPVRVGLVVDLCPADACPRHPEPAESWIDLAGIRLPYLRLPIGAADGAVRIRWALAHAGERAAT